MKPIILAVVSILVISAIFLYSSTTSQTSSEFLDWQARYNKKYSREEIAFRMRIWAKNLAYVNEHNSRYDAGIESFNLQMNQFADLSEKQFAEKYLISFPKKSITTQCTGAQAPTTNLPSQVDWSTKGAVSDVINQGNCGSCWAISTVGSLQGAYFVNKNQKIRFSTQQLIDCSGSYGNNGCQGGLMNLSFFYVRDNGITTEEKYPYKQNVGKCMYNPLTDKVWTISDCTEVTINKELNLLAAIKKGPVSVAVQANQLTFQFYRKGVLSGICGTDLNHGMLAVGYGYDDDLLKKFYKVKNSWGIAWGENGYVRILRDGDGEGKCGIQMAASYPLA